MSVWNQHRGVPGLSLIAESTSNSLLVSAPPERIKDMVDTIKKLDRVPKSATIKFTILDVPAACVPDDSLRRTLSVDLLNPWELFVHSWLNRFCRMSFHSACGVYPRLRSPPGRWDPQHSTVIRWQ
jgi:hypothetical protein